jgi:hypothetical protein
MTTLKRSDFRFFHPLEVRYADVDAQGHVTGSSALLDTDIPNLPASKLTSGTLPTARIGDDAVTAVKLADYSTAQIANAQPTADYIGQLFFNPLDRTLFMWDGNVYQPIGVSYGADPNQVLALLVAATEHAKGVSHNPAPSVVFTGFGANSLDFSVRAWTENFDDAIFVRSALALDIHAALTGAGIQIPFPQRDLHLRSINPEILSQLQRSTP